MQDLNSLSLIGRLTKDAEISYLNNGSAKMDFSVAFTTTKKEGSEWIEESNFLNLSLWGKQAEGLKPYMTKGKQIGIEGHLKQDRWEKDGQKFSALKVIVDNIQLIGSSKKNELYPSNNDPMPF